MSEEFFFHRKSLSLLNETWASFVFRCQVCFDPLSLSSHVLFFKSVCLV